MGMACPLRHFYTHPVRDLGPIAASSWPELTTNPRPYAGLATSFGGDVEYRPRIEGKIPQSLRGTLYRNGPGLFDRAGLRKRMILDGDGLAQAYRFDEEGVLFTARFIRTPKFVDEDRAGAFLYPTWSTLSPMGWKKNVGARIANQAGVTIVEHAGRLLAFDEGQRPVQLDARSLATLGEIDLAPANPKLTFQAHWKWDVGGKGWVPLSLTYGRHLTAEAFFFDESGAPTGSAKAVLPRGVYIHDWFLTAHHMVFLLHPGFVPLGSYLKLLSGTATFAESVRWKPEEGNLIAVVPRSGGAPRLFETDALWMWHSANAYDRGQEIVMDFVGNSTGGGIGTDQSGFYDVMAGREPRLDAEPVSKLHRYVLDLGSGEVRHEVLADGWNFEMPYVDPRDRLKPHRHVYLARADEGQLFWSAVVRLDVKSGAASEFHFGEGAYCTEPVYADGWILTVVYEHRTRKSHLAVLDAEHLSDGPVARVRLEQALPLSFHGSFASRH
jgi:all-trans-8'-apo-beta-carotenal 15,15'-oxygenase